MKSYSWVTVLVMALAMFGLSACAGAQEESLSSVTVKADHVEMKNDETEDSVDTEADIMEGSGRDLDTAPIEVDWFIDQAWFDVVFDPENTLVHKIITEKTGVKINFITPSGDAGQALNAMISTDDYPDIITVSTWRPQVRRLEEAGKVYPLLELIENHAPTFRSILPDSMINWYTGSDGNWYGIPNFFSAVEYEYTGQGLKSHAGFVARTDIMKKLGLSSENFDTTEGLLEALRAVRDSGIRENGQKVIPLVIPAEGDLTDSGMFIYKTLLPAFYGIPIEDEDGNYTDVMLHPKFKEALEFLNMAYREDLLMIDNFVIKSAQVEEIMVSGNGFAYLGALGDSKSYAKELYFNDSTMILEPYGPFRASDNAEPVLYSSGGNGWTVTMIPTATQKQERIIKLFEFLYSEEGSLMGHWGIEGITYQVRDDGKFEFTPDYKALKAEDPEQAAKVYGLGSSYWVHNWQAVMSRTPEATEGAALLEENMDKYYDKWIRDGRALTNIEPDAGSEAAVAKAQIDGYLRDQLPKVILSDSEDAFDKAFATMIDMVYELGQGEVTEAMNEKYQANRDKLD